MQISNFTRKCPNCGKDLFYKSNTSYKRAIKREDLCRNCCGRKNSLPQNIIDKILDLNSQEVLNREIARQLGINHRTVAYYLKKNNKYSNFANQPIDIISTTEARCKKCKSIKSISEFQFGRKGQKYEYKFSFCNECRKKQIRLNLNNDVDKFLADCFSRAKRRAKDKNIIFEISKEEYISQYHTQNGLCFYTDEIMICKVGDKLNRNSLSVDKIIPEKGYIKGNVVFTTHRINTCKNDLSLNEIEKWMPSWHERIKVFLNV